MWCCDVNACFGRAGFGPAASVAVRSFRSKGVAEYLSNADTPIYVYIHIYIYIYIYILYTHVFTYAAYSSYVLV